MSKDLGGAKTKKSLRDFAQQIKEEKATEKMPVLFVGHGNPMNVLPGNEFGAEWERIGQSLPTPRAIVVMSAHWLTRGSYVTAMEKPRMIYDFYGFPDEMYKIDYPAVGDVALARELGELQKHIKMDHEWGLDHGAWIVLARMYPRADIPVLQLSIDLAMSPLEQYQMMKDLAILRRRGVLFMGSGNVVHNLGMLRTDGVDYDWSIEFDALVRDMLIDRDYARLVRYEKLGSLAQLAIPTDDHYRPMLLSIGLTDKSDEIKFFNESIDLGSVSMRSFVMS